MADRDGGVTFDAGTQTVGEYLDRWLTDSVRDSVKPRTFSNYSLQVRQHITPALGRVKLKNLSPAHIQSFYRTKLDAGLSPSSVRYIHAVLHRALKQALRWGLVPRNVTEAVDIPKLVREEITALSPEQARVFLSTARGDRYEALYQLAIRTGLRRGELLGLRWRDIDLDVGVLQTVRQLQRLRDQKDDHGNTVTRVTFSSLKSGKGRRIRLTVPVAEALRAHRARQAEEKLRLGNLYEDQDLVFATEAGTPLEASNIDRRSFKPILHAAGLPDIRFHDLRHTCATLLLSGNTPPKVVQEILGHADIALTLNTYSHVMPDMQEHAAEAMDRVLS
jgi:integrase